MKKLTLSRVAAASIRANRKSYRSLAVGIFLAVYLAAAVTLCFYGVWQAHERLICRYVGKTDCVLLDEPGLSDERLRDSGLFSRIGHLYMKAAVQDSNIYLAYADEDAAEILCQEVLEGRLPERAGEIALERGVLQQLRLDAQVGDTLRLTLRTINGADEERELTLVGVLFPQSKHFQAPLWNFDRVYDWPTALISPEEPFASGRTAVHRVMRYAALATTDRVEAYYNEGLANWDAGRYNFFGVDRNDGVLVGNYSNDLLGYEYSLLKQDILFLAAALLLVVGIGIATAMESVLDLKTEEIGLLRAVGATRRQIRRVFARETWLLGLVSLPGALLLAVLTEWLLARLAPEQLCFGVPLWLLLPIVLFAALSIFLSAAYPLWRASRQLPMGVLRDTTLLRKAKGFRSRKSFSVSRLIALRQLRLRPWRQLGAALMLCLSLLMLAAFPSALDGWGDWLEPGIVDDFDLWPAGVAFESYYELSEQDLAQLRAIEHVKTVASRGATSTYIVPEGELPAYLRPFYTDENGNIACTVDPYKYDESHVRVVVFLTDSVADLDEAVLAEGVIDWDAINRGEQLLVYAPECYAVPEYRRTMQTYIESEEPEDMFYDCTWASDQYELYGSMYGKPAAHIENDFFHAGQALSLVQFIRPANPDIGWPEESVFWTENALGTEKRQCNVTVGAVLSRFPQLGGANVTLITSYAGARALGLGGIQTYEIGVSLDGSVDAETEQRIEERVTDIALRGDMEVINWVAEARECREYRIRNILLIGCVLLLFTATAIAMQVSGADRAIRADARKIGTLRAVGANEKTLRRCYLVPMLFGIGLGTALALVLARWWIVKVFDWGSMSALAYPLMLLFAALCALCCLVALRLRLKQVLSRSIVENIREL